MPPSRHASVRCGAVQPLSSVRRPGHERELPLACAACPCWHIAPMRASAGQTARAGIRADHAHGHDRGRRQGQPHGHVEGVRRQQLPGERRLKRWKGSTASKVGVQDVPSTYSQPSPSASASPAPPAPAETPPTTVTRADRTARRDAPRTREGADVYRAGSTRSPTSRALSLSVREPHGRCRPAHGQRCVAASESPNRALRRRGRYRNRRRSRWNVRRNSARPAQAQDVWSVQSTTTTVRSSPGVLPDHRSTVVTRVSAR